MKEAERKRELEREKERKREQEPEKLGEGKPGLKHSRNVSEGSLLTFFVLGPELLEWEA